MLLLFTFPFTFWCVCLCVFGGGGGGGGMLNVTVLFDGLFTEFYLFAQLLVTLIPLWAHGDVQQLQQLKAGLLIKLMSGQVQTL